MATKINFQEFWPHYREKHSDPTCRALHFVGTSFAIVLCYVALLTQAWQPALLGIAIGYALAWVGHCFFEHNTPAKIEISMRESYGDVREILAGAMGAYKAETDKQYSRNAVQRAAVLESSRKTRERRRKAEDALRRSTTGA
jgi:hypothetical protein